MSSLSEPSHNEQENLSKAGHKTYSAAIRTVVIGGIASFLSVLLAIATLFIENSDSAGPGFFVFGFLAIAIFILADFTVILLSMASFINYATMLNRNNDSREESINGITKSIGLILGVVLVSFIAFKLLNMFW